MWVGWMFGWRWGGLGWGVSVGGVRLEMGVECGVCRMGVWHPFQRHMIRAWKDILTPWKVTLGLYHHQPPWYLSPPENPDARFSPITVLYLEEVYYLLMEMNLARREQDKWFEPEHWVLHECLAAGKWNYRSDSGEFFLASIPILSAIPWSSTDFKCCDVRFHTSYLIKYLSSKEENQLTSVSSTKNINE